MNDRTDYHWLTADELPLLQFSCFSVELFCEMVDAAGAMRALLAP